MPSGYTTALATTICPDVAVLKRDVSGTPTVFGVSRGGLRFTPNVDWQNLPFDGKHDDIEGNDRVLKRDGVISGTFIEIKDAYLNADLLEPGVTMGTAGTPTTITHTPVAGATFLSTGDYVTNLDMVFTRGDGKSVIVRFAKAICTKYDIVSQDPNGAEVNVEFHSRLSQTAAASSTDTASYVWLVVG